MDYFYAPMFQLGKDTTEYYCLTKEGVSVSEFEGHPILKVAPEALEALSHAAFRDVNFLLRRSHNLQVASILNDPQASENDKYMARKASRYGPASATKRPFLKAFTRLIPRRTCATARTPR